MYAALTSDSEFHVALSSAQKRNFEENLDKDFESIRSSLEKIDARNASAHSPNDKKMIFDTIRESVGFLKLNAMIQMYLQNWLAETGKQSLEKLEKAHREYCKRLTVMMPRAKKKESKKQIKEKERTMHIKSAMFRNSLGKLFRDQGKFKESKEMFEVSLKDLTKWAGKNDRNTLKVLNNKAYILQQMKNHKEAVKYYLECYKSRKKAFGSDDNDTAQSLSNLGTCLLEMDKISEARERLVKAVATRTKIKPNHPATLYTISFCGVALSRSGPKYWEEAEKMHQEAYQALKKHPWIGHGHPLTLYACHNYGIHHLEKKNWQHAMKFLKKCHDGRYEKLGKEHAQTIKTRKLLIEVKKKLGFEDNFSHTPREMDKNIPTFVFEKSVTNRNSGLGKFCRTSLLTVVGPAVNSSPRNSGANLTSENEEKDNPDFDQDNSDPVTSKDDMKEVILETVAVSDTL